MRKLVQHDGMKGVRIHLDIGDKLARQIGVELTKSGEDMGRIARQGVPDIPDRLNTCLLFNVPESMMKMCVPIKRQ